MGDPDNAVVTPVNFRIPSSVTFARHIHLLLPKALVTCARRAGFRISSAARRNLLCIYMSSTDKVFHPAPQRKEVWMNPDQDLHIRFIDSEQSKLVSPIFELCAEGFSAQATADKLHAR